MSDICKLYCMSMTFCKQILCKVHLGSLFPPEGIFVSTQTLFESLHVTGALSATEVRWISVDWASIKINSVFSSESRWSDVSVSTPDLSSVFSRRQNRQLGCDLLLVSLWLTLRRHNWPKHLAHGSRPLRRRSDLRWEFSDWKKQDITVLKTILLPHRHNPKLMLSFLALITVSWWFRHRQFCSRHRFAFCRRLQFVLCNLPKYLSLASNYPSYHGWDDENSIQSLVDYLKVQRDDARVV